MQILSIFIKSLLCRAIHKFSGNPKKIIVKLKIEGKNSYFEMVYVANYNKNVYDM